MARRPKLAQMRINKRMTANQLAKESGVALTTILDIEAEKIKKPQLATIERLSRALGCAAEDIEWPGNPLRQPPYFDTRMVQVSVQVAMAALVLALQNPAQFDVPASMNALVSLMQERNYNGEQIATAIDQAQAVAEGYM